MALKDIALTAAGDLLINENGDLEIINSVRQAISIKLRWIKGEWIFNTEFGTPYFESILVKAPNDAVIEKTIKDQILSVDGVTGVNSISVLKDSKKRKLKVSFIARTTSGDIESEVELSHAGLWDNV